MSSIKTALEKFGVKQKRSNGKRYYEMPPMAGHILNRMDNKRSWSSY